MKDGNGLTEKTNTQNKTEPTGKPYIAYFSRNTVMLDLDDMHLSSVIKIAKNTTKNHNLGGYIITESSPNHYHAIFNEPQDWINIMMILFAFRKDSILAYAINQARKGFCALRVNNAKNGYKPHIIKEYGKTDKAISEYKHILNQYGET